MVLMFGKTAPKPHLKTIPFARVFNAGNMLPPPPHKNFWEYKVKSWPMFDNDTLGDCVFAAGGHMIQNWTAHSGVEVVPADADILAGYEAVGGYIPGNPATDNGAAITDFLNYWQTKGFAGRKILGWCGIDVRNLVALKQALFLFGALDIGIQVPASAMSQFAAGAPWDVIDDDGGIQGGHSIPVMGQGANGMACITWGRIQYMTNAFIANLG